MLFLEANFGPTWQPGMLMEGTDIQHNPLRDFITPKNPCSPFGFLSYLKANDRLFHFLNLDSPYPPRSEYARYISWVADHFADQVSYSTPVVAIDLDGRIDPATGRRLVRVSTKSGDVFGRALSFAPGRSANIPEAFTKLLGDQIFHFTEYVHRRDGWRRGGKPASVAVIGASQSAVEIIIDLHATFSDVNVSSVFRAFSYVLKDTSPFTEDLLFPSHTDYFYHASPDSKKILTEQVRRSNYSSVDHDVLKHLYFLRYEQAVRGEDSISVWNNADVLEAAWHGDQIRMRLLDRHTGEAGTLDVDAVVLATGFRNFGVGEHEELCHPLLRGLYAQYEKNDDGTLRVTRRYQLIPSAADAGTPPVFLNGLCESTHGLGDAGSFSLLSYRAFDIHRTLTAAVNERTLTDL